MFNPKNQSVMKKESLKKEIVSTIVLTYRDKSKTTAEVKVSSLADSMMITRGWLMSAETAVCVEAYDEESFVLAAYQK